MPPALEPACAGSFSQAGEPCERRERDTEM